MSSNPAKVFIMPVEIFFAWIEIAGITLEVIVRNFHNNGFIRILNSYGSLLEGTI
jgi:hypothetical protein